VEWGKALSQGQKGKDEANEKVIRMTMKPERRIGENVLHMETCGEKEPPQL
jgi:hypothetical protein